MASVDEINEEILETLAKIQHNFERVSFMLHSTARSWQR